MAFDSYLYGDPERVLIRKQEAELKKAKACGDCVHRRTIEFKGETLNHCEYKRRQYGRGCELFEIKKGA